MSTRKKAPKRNAATAVGGLRVDDPEGFINSTRTALQKALEIPFTRAESWETGHRQCCYFVEAVPVRVPGTDKDMPALPLHVGDEQSAWLVVELELDTEAPAQLLQANLKVHQGPTTETSILCFRAEWDMRDSNSQHAQPHWNIHAPQELLPAAPEVATFQDFIERSDHTFASFADNNRSMARSPSSGPPEAGFSAMHMHRFHFAMCADWHGETGASAPVLENVGQVVKWIAGCAGYMRSQFDFIMSQR